MISACVAARATARPVCDALESAMATHGVPEAVLTDSAKVFTARFGPGPGPVRFDRICTSNGITHIRDGVGWAPLTMVLAIVVTAMGLSGLALGSTDEGTAGVLLVMVSVTGAPTQRVRWGMACP